MKLYPDGKFKAKNIKTMHLTSLKKNLILDFFASEKTIIGRKILLEYDFYKHKP